MSRKISTGITKRVFIFLVAFLALTADYSESHAQEVVSDKVQEIVIVLDLSQSMQNVDSYHKSVEFVKELAATLPSTYQIGLIAYRDEIVLSLPVGSSYDEIDKALSQIEYKSYGNAGMGLKAAINLFESRQTDKQIIMISDGEIMMKTEELTKESAQLFAQSTDEAETAGIKINVLALGKPIEEGETIYSAATATNGMLYELKNGDRLEDFAGELIFKEMKVKARQIGKMDGNSGELQVRLPDCLMKKAKLVLMGRQQNENLTVNCESDKINVLKGKNYTVIELENPTSEEITIQMSSGKSMDVTAYLMAEYEFVVNVSSTYDPAAQQFEIAIDLKNTEERNLLSFEVYLGSKILNREIILPEIEKPKPQIDWFFWSVMILFVVALTLIFIFSGKKNNNKSAKRRVIDESKVLPDESRAQKNDFYGKVQVYVTHNREDIDYPPESINLFARCNREVITLEWILDTCNLPLNLKEADKVVIRPGADKSLIIKNSGKVTAMKGRELLEKGYAYHLYYHEKVTFIFDQEDTEIEVHYKDLKPNER